MRAFLITWRSLVSFYNELFLLLGMNLLWWVTGGIFVGVAVALGWATIYVGGPWWLAPVFAIPAGPAAAGLANVTHRVARDLRADRSFFFDGIRQYWKKALGVSTVLALVTALLILNILFYATRPEPIIKGLAFLFIVLLLYWLGVQIYVFPVLVGMKQPSILGAIKMAAMMAFANPLYSLLIIIIAGLLTGLSVVLAVLVLIAWPTVLMLLGAHSLKLMVVLAGGEIEGEQGEKDGS